MREFIPSSVLEILDKLEQNGFPSYLVGGCVRDFLLSLPPKDWDICTPATPSEILEIFPNSIELGAKYGTIGIKTPIGIIQATTFRTESDYQDFRHPKVSFCKEIDEDLKRRDFTINAIAYNLGVGFYDPFGGREDLEKGVISCVGEAKLRFQEDALRILRLVRFSSRFDFAPQKDTLSSAIEYSPLLSHISQERIREELLGIFQTSFWSKHFSIFAPIYSQVFPELKKPFKHKISNLSILFAYILGSEKELEALQRLKIDKTTQKRTEILLRYKNQTLENDKISIKLLLKDMGYDNFTALLELQKLLGKDIKGVYKTLQNLMIADECFSLKDLKVNGNDIASLGYEREKIGEILENLLEQVIRGELPNQKEALLKAFS